MRGSQESQRALPCRPKPQPQRASKGSSSSKRPAVKIIAYATVTASPERCCASSPSATRSRPRRRRKPPPSRRQPPRQRPRPPQRTPRPRRPRPRKRTPPPTRPRPQRSPPPRKRPPRRTPESEDAHRDRKSVAEGKKCAIRVDYGGRGRCKNKTQQQH